MANTFETEVRDSAKSLGIYYQRLPLPPRLNNIILKKNPYDSFMLLGQKFCALELKSQEEHGSFTLSRLPQNQTDGLGEVLSHGADSWILINMRKKKGKLENKCWAFHFKDIDDIISMCLTKNGKQLKSIPLELFDTCKYIIPIERTHSPIDKKLCWRIDKLEKYSIQ